MIRHTTSDFMPSETLRHFLRIITTKEVMSKKHYRPLPEGVIVKNSAIEGLGLFATKDFPAGHDFGITHVADERFPDEYIRTPLGGFYNHSDDPNCVAQEEDGMRRLVALRDIRAGEELTATYRLYNPQQTE